MYIQLIIFVLAILAYFFLQNKESNNPLKARKQYITFISILLVLQSGLRNWAVGPDTYQYYIRFSDTLSTSWSEIWHRFYEVYVLNEGKDAGYTLFEKIFQIFCEDYQVYLVFVAVIFFASLGRFLYRHSKSNVDVLLALAIYQSLFYGFMSITGIRQTLATAMTLIAFDYILDKKLWKFIITMAIAAIMHKSSLIFVPLYFIANYKSYKKLLIGCGIGALVIFPYVRNVATFMAMVSAQENYMAYVTSNVETAGARTFALMMVLIFIALIVYSNDIVKKDSKNQYFINAFALAIIFTPLTWVEPALMRIVQYFSIFILLLIPSIVNCAQVKTKANFLYAIVILAFIYITLSKNYEYKFFWEYMKLGDNYFM